MIKEADIKRFGFYTKSELIEEILKLEDELNKLATVNNLLRKGE